MGAKKKPIYRIVAADSRKSPNGKFLETLGHYNPNITENQVKINRERVDHWIKLGAQVSDTVGSLLKKQSA
jgi:small subunit ribosomal protein S16